MNSSNRSKPQPLSITTGDRESDKKVLLLGTAGCHLCEEAAIILSEVIDNYVGCVEVEKIDIAVQEQWLERYAVRIPVIFHPKSQQELCWPFNQYALKNFFQGLENE